MKLRALGVLVLASTLGGCFLWSSDSKGPAPSSLPVFQATAELRNLWRGSVSAADGSLLQPAVINDAVFAAGRDGTLVRYENGREVWRVKALKRLSAGVASDGEVVVVGTSDGQLQALEANSGKERWRVEVGGEVLGTPLVDGGLVVVRVGNNRIAAFQVADGKRKWIYQRAQAALALRSYSGFARAGDLILAGFAGGKLVALTLAGGFPHWEATIAQPRGSNELERMADIVGTPAVTEGGVCVAAFQGRVACVDRYNGVTRWARDLSSAVGLDADDKAVYVTDRNGALLALDIRTGASLWKQDRLLYRGVGGPLIVGEYVAVGDAQGWVHLVERGDGRFAAQTRADSSPLEAPLARLGSAAFVAQSRDGSLRVLAPR